LLAGARFSPLRFIFVDLSKIKHVTLRNPATGDAAIFYKIPIVVLL
jgi:hypothetical protein